MKISRMMSGAAAFALVAGLASAQDPSKGFEEEVPGHSEPWPGDDDDGSSWDAGTDGGDPPDYLHDDDDIVGSPGGDFPDDDMIAIPIWYDDGSCAECNFAETGPGEVTVTATPRRAERREANRDWRELHQANQRNVCFDADLYVPLLCEWQRPFLGDQMP